MRQRWFVATALLLAAGLALSGSPTSAQTQTGNIYGTVKDSGQGPLPGAAVELQSPQRAPQTVYTDVNGRFRFVDLPPGNYNITATMEGFQGNRMEGIDVRVGVSADLSFTLVATVGEVVTVTSEQPVVDVKQTGTATNVPYEELQKLPNSRDPWGVLNQVPGVMTDRINVGGSESGQQSNFTGKGDDGNNAMWNVDGVTITDAAAIGSSPTYYNFDAFEEIQVTTGGSDPSVQTGGVAINFVTRRGTDDFTGSVHTYYTNDALQGSNVSDDLKKKNFKGNRIQSIAEYGFEIGGPISKGMAWFWASAARNDIRQLNISDVSDRTELNNYALKLNFQPASNTNMTFFTHYGDKVKSGRQAVFTTDQNATWDQSGPTAVYKLEGSQLFGSSFYLSGKVAYVDGGFRLEPNGKGATVYDLNTGEYLNNLWLYDTDRPQYQGNVDGSFFTATGPVDHEFKFGFQYRRTPVESYTTWVGDDGQLSLWGFDPVVGIAYFYRPYTVKGAIDTLSIYAGDTVTWGDLTANVGLRFDRQEGENDASKAEASAYVPELTEVTFNGKDPGFTWSNVVPRLGLSYALGAEGRTVIKANYAWYADQLGVASVFNNNLTYQGLAYYFEDANGNHFADKGEVRFDWGLYDAVQIDPDDTSKAIWGATDSDLSAPETQEVLIGLDQELLNDFAIGVNMSYRQRDNDTWAPYMKVDAAGNMIGTLGVNDWEVSRVIDVPLDYNHDGVNEEVRKFTLWKLKSGVTLNPGKGRYLTNRPDYYEEYKGIELSVVKRLANKWMARAGFSWNDWKQHFDSDKAMFWPYDLYRDDDIVAPSSLGSGAKGSIALNARWQVNIAGLYQLPVGFEVGANVFAREGYPAPLLRRTSTPVGTQNLQIERMLDAERMDNVYNFDLRLSNTQDLGKAGSITVDADIFNVLNNDVVIQRNLRTEQSSFWNEREIMAPRIFRLGLRYRF
ncbi:MAG: TonB-dependent receptor [Candidatus Schekmanbacteria bacterium]|nr:TonB-dependent receptor [Candidatus Schekmanbacteria bacterium]